MPNSPSVMKARYAPVYWEPMPSVSERFVSIVVVQPVSAESEVCPTARVVLSVDRLRAMFGRSAKHIFGILKETADLLTHLLEQGAPIEALEIPFNGFRLGEIRVARGRTIEQMLDGAVRSISSLGEAEALYQPTSISIRRQTQATGSFLQKVRLEFSGGDPVRKQRFRRDIITQKTRVPVTIDYAFERWLVQVASLPHVRQQDVLLKREAQSKLFEMDALQRDLDGNARPILLVNASALRHPINNEAQDLALAANENFIQWASIIGAEVIQAQTAMEGVHALERLH